MEFAGRVVLTSDQGKCGYLLHILVPVLATGLIRAVRPSWAMYSTSPSVVICRIGMNNFEFLGR